MDSRQGEVEIVRSSSANSLLQTYVMLYGIAFLVQRE
jgi:hypothetical protein